MLDLLSVTTSVWLPICPLFISSSEQPLQLPYLNADFKLFINYLFTFGVYPCLTPVGMLHIIMHNPELIHNLLCSYLHLSWDENNCIKRWMYVFSSFLNVSRGTLSNYSLTHISENMAHTLTSSISAQGLTISSSPSLRLSSTHTTADLFSFFHSCVNCLVSTV